MTTPETNVDARSEPVIGRIRRAPDWVLVAVVAGTILLFVGAAVFILDRVTSSSPAVSPGNPTAASDEPTSAILRNPNALMLAGRAGDVLLGLALRPGGPIDVSAIQPTMEPLPLDAVHAVVEGHSSLPTSCGANCFRVRAIALRGSPVTLTISITRPGKAPATAVFRLPGRLPAPAEATLRAATRRMKALRSVRDDEILSSGLATVRTRFELEAPNRLTYAIAGGGRAIIIGSRRWDLTNGRWLASPYQPLTVPSYIWQGAARARLLGRATLDGQSVRMLAAFRPDPEFPAWFLLYVTPDGRVLRAEMKAPAHFMVDRFSRFDRPLSIEPPSR